MAFCVLSGAAFAQVSPDLEQGMKPYGSYHGGNLDNVSMSNGNLFFHADLMAYSQRGGELAYPIVLQYNGENLHMQSMTCPAGVKDCPIYVVMGSAWSTSTASTGSSVTVGFEGIPTIVGQRINTGLTYNGQAIYVTLNSVLTPDGSLHSLANTTSGGTMTLDGSGFAGLVDRYGTKYTSLIEDANGNQITPSSSGWTDTVGRQLPLPPLGGSMPITSVSTPPASTASLSACPALGYTNQAIGYAYAWSLPTVNGGTLPLTLCYASVYVNTGVSGEYLHQVNETFAMLQSVVFPDGTYWAFQYDAGDPNNSSLLAYGDLLKITFPTGGSISYTWGPCACTTAFARSVMTRSVDANDGNGPQTWHYSYNNASFTIVQDPLGNETTHSLTNLGGSLSSFYEVQAQYFQGSHTSGSLLKTVTTDYQYTPNVYDSGYASGGGSESVTNVFPIRVTTTLPNGLVTKTETDYDNALAYHGPLDGIQYNQQSCNADDINGTNQQTCVWSPTYTMPVTNYSGSYGKVIATREYDWGAGAPGPLLRQTLTNYLWQSNSNYLTYNFLDLVSSSTVQDGGGNQVAQTTYGYDEYALNPSGISTQRNASPSNGSIRGNQTSVHHWLNGSTSATSSCPVSVSNGLVTSYAQYNDTGTVYKSTDSCGSSAGDPNHTTTHSYSSSYAGAYPTQTCLPTVNNVTQCVSGTYDFNTGLLTSFTDANGQTSNYSYDNRWRMMQALFPAVDTSGVRPETDFYYPNATTVQRCKKQSSSASSTACGAGWIVDYASFDGLGRTKQTRLVDPEGDDFVDTTYDALGRVSTVSNPHRSTGSSTDGTTTSHYDALGRVTQVVKQDGSVSSVQYDLATGTANCTISTDEAGKQRKACSDGLGRLTRVWEDPAGLNFETDYQYDTLGNLLRVDQKGSAPGDSSQWRTRTCTYDSLSQLLSAFNPESGQISYSYDATGEVITKTAPAPNQLGTATVTTSYYYDVLHRLTQKSYSDGATPHAAYSYDIAAPWGWQLSNYIGRLVVDATYDSTSNALLTANLYNYDPLGRTSLHEQCQPQDCVHDPSLFVSYVFDLTGQTTSQTDGQGGIFNVTYSYSYNAAGRATGMTSNYNDAQHPFTLASITLHNPVGDVQKLYYGNNLAETAVYNNRLQPCRGNVNSSSSTLQNCTDATPSGTVQDFKYGFNTGSGNNGNVLLMTGTGNQTFNRSYGYDGLNRLTSLSAPGDQCTAMTWTYDAWANRTAQAGTGGTQCHSGSGTVFTNNQLVGYSYDAAGNMLSDGIHHYAYDAENRIISVDNGATTYTYDAQGRRVTKLIGGAWRNYLYDMAGQVVAETMSSGWQVGYGYLSGKLLSQYRDSTTYFFQQDHLGSTRLVTKMDQSVYDSTGYLPYGELISGGNGSTHKFTGKERDAETSLDNFGARMYGNALGRFITPDPLLNSGRPGDPQTWNRYSFVRNSPLSRVDPTGLYDLNNTCDSGDKKCNKEFRQNADKLKNGLKNLQKKLKDVKDPAQKARLANALHALGTEGDHNGVNVAFGATQGGGAGETDPVYHQDTGKETYNVTLDPSKLSSENDYAVAGAHEGTHVDDITNYLANPSWHPDLSNFALEYRGYQTSIYAASALGESSLSFEYDGTSYELWNGSWSAVDKNITNYVTKFHDQSGKLDHPETKPHSPWQYDAP